MPRRRSAWPTRNGRRSARARGTSFEPAGQGALTVSSGHRHPCPALPACRATIRIASCPFCLSCREAKDCAARSLGWQSKARGRRTSLTKRANASICRRRRKTFCFKSPAGCTSRISGRRGTFSGNSSSRLFASPDLEVIIGRDTGGQVAQSPPPHAKRVEFKRSRGRMHDADQNRSAMITRRACQGGIHDF